MYWEPERKTLEAWGAVARAFVLRKPAAEQDVRSEELGNQGGAWLLQFGRFTDPDDRPMPFAAIFDVLPSVVIVPSLMPDDELFKELREHVWGYARAAGRRVEMNDQALMDLGAWSQAASPGAWYGGLRERWMATRAQLLVVTASVPDPRGPTHYFYAEPITPGDELFRTTVEAVYGESPGRAGTPKSAWLEKMRDDGICALEIVREPTILHHELKDALRDGARAFVDEAMQLDPRGVVICGEPAFSALIDCWPVDTDSPLLQDGPIASPTSSRGRTQLAELITRCLVRG